MKRLLLLSCALLGLGWSEQAFAFDGPATVVANCPTAATMPVGSNFPLLQNQLGQLCGSTGATVTGDSVDYSGRATPTASATKLSSLITWSGATPTALNNGLLCTVISGTGVISFGDTSSLTTSNGYPISTSGPTPHWAGNISTLNEYAISSDGATVISCHGN